MPRLMHCVYQLLQFGELFGFILFVTRGSGLELERRPSVPAAAGRNFLISARPESRAHYDTVIIHVGQTQQNSASYYARDCTGDISGPVT